VFLTERNGARFFGHGGADEGFQADVVVSLDDGYGLVVMASSDNGFQLFPDLERAVFSEYGWRGAAPAIVRVALTPAQRARFVGPFLDGSIPIAITEQGDQLTVRAPFGTPVELIPVAPDRVIQRDSGRQLQLDAAGALTSLRPHQPARALVRRDASARHHLLELEAGRFDDAVATWRARLAADPKTAGEDEDRANRLAFQVMARDPAQAIQIVRLVATVFPESSNAHDSLGEAYAQAGDKPRAIAAYEQALATLDADPRVPADSRRTRRSHAEAELAKLRAR
jgi:hypothetical protein